MQISLLLDFYGSLLKENLRRAVELYYDDDLSLSEAALALGITRQGVRDCVKRAEAQLVSFEDRLGLLGRFQETESGLREIESIASQLCEGGGSESEKKKAERILKIAKSLHE